MWRRWPKRFLSQQTPKELFSRNLYIIRYIHSYQKEGQKACLYGDDNGIFVLSEQGRWWPYSAFVRSEAMTATFVWQKISRHILYSFFFFFLSHCSEVALVLYIWHLVTVTLIWFDFYLTTEPMSICRHVGELAPSILPPDLDIQLLSNSYLIKVIVMALWFLFLAFVLQCFQLWHV